MRTPRLFVDAELATSSEVELPTSSAHYIGRVLRLAQNAKIVLFNGDGAAFAATLVAVTPKSAKARIGEEHECDVESPLCITLVQGLCRGQRMDLCVQKATELGVARIVPLAMDRSVVRLDAGKASKRMQHWRGIAIGACEQSGRVVIPKIDAPTTLEQFLAAQGNASLAMLDADGDRYDDWQNKGDALTLVVGPEGGYSDAERERLAAAGAARWAMGPRILRTETAGMIALALAQGKWGDLR